MINISKLISTDDGYGDTDTAIFAKNSNGDVYIHCDRRASYLVSGTEPDDGAICVKVDDREYTSPLRLKNSEAQIRIASDAYPGSNHNAALIGAALNSQKFEFDENSILVSGLPVRSYYDLAHNGFGFKVHSTVDKKKQGIAKHTIESFSSSFTSKISIKETQHKVVPESVGVALDILYSDQGARRNAHIFEGLSNEAYLLTIDMGSRTTDICGLTQDLTPVRWTLKTIDVGLNDVYSRFKDLLIREDDGNLIYMAGISPSALSDDKVRQLFKDGSIMLMRSADREVKTIKHLAEIAFRSVISDDIVPKMDDIKDDLSNVAAIVLAGGGAAINGYMQQCLREDLSLDMHIVEENKQLLAQGLDIESDSELGCKILCAPRPEFGNVRGFLKWLAFIHLENSPEQIDGMKDDLPIIDA